MKKKSQHLSVRLSMKQYLRLKEMLQQTGMTKSQLIRLALTNYITKK